jgi:hypothetical protein
MLSEFTNEQIISMLKEHSLWGKRACREIISRKDDFIPMLIEILDNVINDPGPYMSDDEEGHIPSVLLLAQMREKQAYSRVIKLMYFNEDDCDFLWGDMVTQFFNWILRDTYNGDSSLLPALIETPTVFPWSRAMAVNAWGMHYYDGHIAKDECTGFLRRLIHDVYADNPTEGDIIVLSAVAEIIREHQFDDLMEDVMNLYSRGAIDEDICGSKEEYVNDFADPEYGVTDRHIDDTIKELAIFHWFKKEDPADEKDDFDDDDYFDYDDFDDDEEYFDDDEFED